MFCVVVVMCNTYTENKKFFKPYIQLLGVIIPCFTNFSLKLRKLCLKGDGITLFACHGKEWYTEGGEIIILSIISAINMDTRLPFVHLDTPSLHLFFPRYVVSVAESLYGLNIPLAVF